MEPHRPTEPEGTAFTIAEYRDRLDVESRALRRHFWRRLLPGVGVTSYLVASVVAGWGTPALVAGVLFGGFTAREALRFRRRLGRVRGLEDDLAAVSDPAGGADPTAASDPTEDSESGEGDRA